VTRPSDTHARWPWPPPGRRLFLEAEPRLAAVIDIVRAALSAGGVVPWDKVTLLVDSLVGPDRADGVVRQHPPHLEVAFRALRSLDVRNAVMAELTALDARADFAPREPVRPTFAEQRSRSVPSSLVVRPEWVGE
jgi:hypothetical protein